MLERLTGTLLQPGDCTKSNTTPRRALALARVVAPPKRPAVQKAMRTRLAGGMANALERSGHCHSLQTLLGWKKALAAYLEGWVRAQGPAAHQNPAKRATCTARLSRRVGQASMQAEPVGREWLLRRPQTTPPNPSQAPKWRRGSETLQAWRAQNRRPMARGPAPIPPHMKLSRPSATTAMMASTSPVVLGMDSPAAPPTAGSEAARQTAARPQMPSTKLKWVTLVCCRAGPRGDVGNRLSATAAAEGLAPRL